MCNFLNFSQESIGKWERFSADHAEFQTCLSEYNTWLAGVKEQLQASEQGLGDKEALKDIKEKTEVVYK